jgi:hypothetical protein
VRLLLQLADITAVEECIVKYLAHLCVAIDIFAGLIILKWHILLLSSLLVFSLLNFSLHALAQAQLLLIFLLPSSMHTVLCGKIFN